MRLRNSIFELFERTTTSKKKFVEEIFFIFYLVNIFLNIYLNIWRNINQIRPLRAAKKMEEKNIEIARKLYGQNKETFEKHQQKFSGWVSNGRSLFDLIKKAQETSSFDELDEGWQRVFIGLDEAYRFWQ